VPKYQSKGCAEAGLCASAECGGARSVAPSPLIVLVAAGSGLRSRRAPNVPPLDRGRPAVRRPSGHSCGPEHSLGASAEQSGRLHCDNRCASTALDRFLP